MMDCVRRADAPRAFLWHGRPRGDRAEAGAFSGRRHAVVGSADTSNRVTRNLPVRTGSALLGSLVWVESEWVCRVATLTVSKSRKVEMRFARMSELRSRYSCANTRQPCLATRRRYANRGALDLSN